MAQEGGITLTKILLDRPIITVTPEMVEAARYEADTLKRQWGRKTTNFNDKRDLIGSLGEQAFNMYLQELGLERDEDYIYDELRTTCRGGDCYDFKFDNGAKVDVKTSAVGYDLLVKVEAHEKRPCDYYVLACYWDTSPAKICLVGYATDKQVGIRKPIMLKAWDYVVKEQHLKNVEYFRRYGKNV